VNVIKYGTQSKTNSWKHLLSPIYGVVHYSDIPIKMFQKNRLFLTVLLLSKWDKNIGMLLLSGRVVVHLTKSSFQFSIGDYMKWPGCRPFNQVFFSIFNW